MTKPNRPGMAFQDFVAALDRALYGAEGVTIESPGWVEDAGGERREHDVLIRRKVGLHEIITAVECRDKSRKVGVPDLEAFARKCDRTRVDHRVMVSSLGFTGSALKAAPAERIQCLTLQEVERFDWLGSARFVSNHRSFVKMKATLFSKTTIVQPCEIFSSDDDTVITRQVLSNVASRAMNEAEIPPGWGQEKIGRLEIDWTYPNHAIDANGVRHELDFIRINAEVKITQTIQEIRTHAYGGVSDRLEVATSPVDVPGLKGEIVLIRNPDTSISVMLATGKVENGDV